MRRASPFKVFTLGLKYLTESIYEMLIRLLFGSGHPEPYSCTYIPNSRTSAPSMF